MDQLIPDAARQLARRFAGACPTCAERLAELDRMREDLVAAERDRAADEQTQLALDRIATWRQRIGGRGGNVLRLLMYLADRPGRTLPREDLWSLVCSENVADPRKQAAIVVSHSRTALKANGLAEAVLIDVMPGVGIRMSAESAAALKAHVGEEA